MLFVTWRLQGSLYQKPHCASVAAVDQLLDHDEGEPQMLAGTRLAKIVKRSILKHDGDLYRLRAWVIMHNHIHMLISPMAGISLIARTIMDETETAARGTLWARESYERPATGQEAEIAQTIENHPVQAKLVARPEQWEWSSAYSEQAGSHTIPPGSETRKRSPKAA